MKIDSKPITKRQKQVLDFIKDYINENNYAPSVRDIMNHFDFKSPRGAHKHIITLEEKGYLIRKGVSRGIVLTSKAGAEFHSHRAIPIVGKIAAGEAIEAIENITEAVPFAANFLEDSNEYFALQVQGDSMIEMHIQSKDYALILKQENAKDGDVIVALIDDNYATLKKLKKVSKDEIHLIPENKDMEIIKVKPKQLKIQGKLVGIMRFY
jgi:repressor LexA